MRSDPHPAAICQGEPAAKGRRDHPIASDAAQAAGSRRTETGQAPFPILGLARFPLLELFSQLRVA